MLSKILLLEDDLLLGETLVDLLEDYDVTYVKNGQDALEKTFQESFDLYLFDVNVPQISGIELLQELRNSSDSTPAIFLTSYNDKDTLKKGFYAGADDFITKPFDNDELLLRIEAKLRTKTKECIGSLCHDPQQQCFFLNNVELPLAKKEYELLVLLFKNCNKIVPKERIFDELWSANKNGSDGALRVHITRLKNSIKLNIENIRGVGYRLLC